MTQKLKDSTNKNGPTLPKENTKMSKVYKDGKGLLVLDGDGVFSDLIYSVTDATAAPYNVSVLRGDFLDKRMEKIAVDKSKDAVDVTDAELLIELGVSDVREE